MVVKLNFTVVGDMVSIEFSINIAFRYRSYNLLAGLPVLVHLRRDFLACDKALRAQIAQPAVRSFRVVMLSPILNDDAGFA